jgi:hypothetical protein
MKNYKTLGMVGVAWFSWGCATGAGTAEVESAKDVHEDDVGADDEANQNQAASPTDEPRDIPTDPEAGSAREPQFTAGMSVNEATNAVPDSLQRVNIEQEALAAPLMEPELYEPCALQGHHHFKVRVAVWDGRAVGLDVSTQPNDQKLETCLKQQLSSVEWKDKAKSINTVEYSY